MSGFRHVCDVLDTIPASDEYSRMCINAMREMLKTGKKAWIEKEIANPSTNDPAWVKFIVENMLAGKPLPDPKFQPAHDQKLFRCLDCMDVGLKYTRDVQEEGQEYKLVGHCGCLKGQKMRQVWSKMDDERHRPKKRGRRVVEEQDYPPSDYQAERD